MRLFVRRGRGGAKGRLLVTDEKNGEKFGGMGNNTYLCSVIVLCGHKRVL